MLHRPIPHGFIQATGGSITATNRPVRRGFRNQTSRADLPEVVGRGAAVTPQAGRLRILVVDDEPAILRFLRASLESQGYIVSTAADARTARHGS
jgi:hypothetical protein